MRRTKAKMSILLFLVWWFF